MGIFLARADGLWLQEGAWVRADCPLVGLRHAAVSGGHIAAISRETSEMWLDGRILPCPRDVEALALWQGHALVLSSDTDCLSVADAEGWLVTARIGVYPQDMCILGDEVLVCGGADGLLHRLTLPELQPVRTYAVPGLALRIHARGEVAHTLCTVEDEGLHTTLCRVHLADGRCETLAELPGIPGAVHADETGLWAATSDGLYRLGAGGVEFTVDGFGLVRHIDQQDGAALVTDDVIGLCAVVGPDGGVAVVDRGEVGQAGYC